nr:SGNH/GDSL hydrolase family protein [Candidatus Freyrarchaeum guaymaensis]
MGCPCYVALGDSMIIDYYAGGPGWGAASLLYRNLDDVYPEFKGKDLLSLIPDLKNYNLATDGATTYTVMHWQLPKVPSGPDYPVVVIVTVGGNDLLSRYRVGFREGVEESYRFKERLRKLFSSLLRMVSPIRPRIYVGNIYDPSDGTGMLDDAGWSPWPDGLKVLAEWNERISEVAEEFRLTLVDIHSHFLGHGMHHDNPEIKHYRPEDPTLWLKQVIEPNSRGAHEIRRLFWEEIYRDREEILRLAGKVRGEGEGRLRWR